MNKTFCLGVDIGKYHHQATLIDPNGTIVGSSVKFENNRRDFNQLCSTIKKRLPEKTALKVGMESTGHYYWPLKEFLLEKGYNRLEIINPIETQEKAKTRIRKIKNDKTDSLAIAQITSQREVKPRLKESSRFRELKDLTRFNEKLKSQARFYKQGISVLIERLCPEFYACFGQMFLKTPLITLEGYFIKKTPSQELIPLMIKTSRGRLSRAKAEEIINVLDHSLGEYYRNQNSAFKLEMLLQGLELAQKQIAKTENKIEKLGVKSSKVVLAYSVKGVSPYLAAGITSELGDLKRFSGHKFREKVTAFAGLDASIKESGEYKRQQGNHISKRGSKYLRKYLYYAAKTAVIFDPELKTFYQKKRAQGKHYNVVIIAVARKILLRICAVIKQKRPYELRNS